jgi:hypothetical protein
VVLTLLRQRPMSIGQLYVETRSRLSHVTYDRFVETLDALYALRLISLDQAPLVSLSS